jgi:hypothetical protein
VGLSIVLKFTAERFFLTNLHGCGILFVGNEINLPSDGAGLTSATTRTGKQDKEQMSIDSRYFVKNGKFIHDTDPTFLTFEHKHHIRLNARGMQDLFFFDNPEEAKLTFEKWRREPCEYIALTSDGIDQEVGRLPLTATVTTLRQDDEGKVIGYVAKYVYGLVEFNEEFGHSPWFGLRIGDPVLIKDVVGIVGSNPCKVSTHPDFEWYVDGDVVAV